LQLSGQQQEIDVDDPAKQGGELALKKRRALVLSHGVDAGVGLRNRIQRAPRGRANRRHDGADTCGWQGAFDAIVTPKAQGMMPT